MSSVSLSVRGSVTFTGQSPICIIDVRRFLYSVSEGLNESLSKVKFSHPKEVEAACNSEGWKALVAAV